MIETIRSISAMTERSESLRREGRVIGFVPTMGALHEGHMRLVRAASQECDTTIASIFVNPTQFGPGEDYDRYPRTLERDEKLLEDGGCQILFTVEREAMYPKGFQTWVDVEALSRSLCGASRPGHFRGVATVVSKLFHIVLPHKAYFGWKDAQQGLIIQRMVEDLNFNIEIVLVPTKRDADGLALSSRNQYLSEEQRKQARLIPKAVDRARDYFEKGGRDAKLLIRELFALFDGQAETRVDYISLVSRSTLEPVETIGKDTLLALAVHVGGTRLIDNHLFAEE